MFLTEGNSRPWRRVLLAMLIMALIPAMAAVEAAPPSKPLIAFRRSESEGSSSTRSTPTRTSTGVLESPAPNTLQRRGGIQAVHQDAAVLPASHAAAIHVQGEAPRLGLTQTVAADPRRLAPLAHSETSSSPADFQATNRDALPFAIPRIESLTTAAAGLAIVIGLFLLCMWLLRRSGPKPTTPLPKEAVAVLGRVPLAARHFAHLLQVGNKLVLVSVTPDGVDPITEITEPAEVDRLLGLCMRKHKHSTTAEFQQVLQQLAREPAEGFLGAEASKPYAGARRS